MAQRTTTPPKPYKLADVAQSQINTYALGRLRKAKSRLTTLGFDELNVLNETDSLYADLDKKVRKKYKELYYERYLEVLLWLMATTAKKSVPPDDEIDELVEMRLAGLLDDPNESTHYAYSAEVLRKRDRAKEAIVSVRSKAAKQSEMDKHLRYFLQMSAWYTDFASQDAEIQAFKSAGVKRVMRHEMDDDKTCPVCRKANGEIYSINKIPPLPHLRCRRWFTPVK